ncbi:fimbrial Z protein; signal transducer [Sporocytophaga myxococcoides]|uniref:Fimbrial Z protein signal transducer n=1 Tax=Sporocytophaga myxococcoides TaxID=153721 RepID=A0A098LEM9_9BACT|nr:response regulator transcription factor [Sporocytophaga myxococcoides]GAL85371.1 fimbrial Z protein; signal transducer [Sporocytophaga myxococcoides]
MDKIRIFILDDHYLIREGLKKTLKSVKDFIIVGESPDLADLLLVMKDFNPDILFLEIGLCKRPIVELLVDIKNVSPKTKILAISDCSCEMKVFTSVKAGVAGFISNKADREEVIKAVLEISSGNDYYSPEVTKILMKGLFAGRGTDIQFSERESEIMNLICQGITNDSIASQLFLSENTVATHKRNIMKKAGVRRTSDLILWALDKKLIARTS